MNRDVKARWVEALRSGRYVQGHHGLRLRDDKRCCLGVLLDVEGVQPRPLGEDANRYTFEFHDSATRGGGAWLPPVFAAIVGLTDAQQRTLGALNDGDGADKHTFAEIADYIEMNV